jgi:hypothetical protein
MVLTSFLHPTIRTLIPSRKIPNTKENCNGEIRCEGKNWEWKTYRTLQFSCVIRDWGETCRIDWVSHTLYTFSLFYTQLRSLAAASQHCCSRLALVFTWTHEGFVLERVAMWQVSVWAFRCSFPNSIPLTAQYKDLFCHALNTDSVIK